MVEKRIIQNIYAKHVGLPGGKVLQPQEKTTVEYTEWVKNKIINKIFKDCGKVVNKQVSVVPKQPEVMYEESKIKPKRSRTRRNKKRNNFSETKQFHD